MIDDNDWKDIFSQPYVAARETKLQSLQYRIIHRIFPCKKWLYIHKVAESPTCNLCNTIEDIVHCLVDCIRVKEFWIDLQKWWNRLVK